MNNLTVYYTTKKLGAIEGTLDYMPDGTYVAEIIQDLFYLKSDGQIDCQTLSFNFYLGTEIDLTKELDYKHTPKTIIEQLYNLSLTSQRVFYIGNKIYPLNEYDRVFASAEEMAEALKKLNNSYNSLLDSYQQELTLKK